MNKRNGFTLIEVMIAIVFVLTVIAIGFSGYIGWHFITKFW